ncbi:MAG: S8 family peptidase [Fimbriimonadaceae bacterium]
MQIVLTVVGLLALSNQSLDKLDTGITDSKEMQPIFVRMESQLFKKGGDYEQFCNANDEQPRSKLHSSILKTLHRNADQSWNQVKDQVDELTTKGEIRDVHKFWIVNGFSCSASANACKSLAARPEVSFIYLQTGPSGLKQQISRRKNSDAEDPRKPAMESAITSSKDDSNQPFSTQGVEVPWDLKQIQADQVWSKEGVTGKGTIVAINDAGAFDLPCLESALWHNSKESLNGKDDDKNGYIDDIFGWDSGEQSGYVLGNPGVAHGTFCSAIVAGRPTTEKKFVSGVAPRSRVMLVNGMGYLEGIEYALTNGADVFSMSYMITGIELGNYRGVFRLAAEHATAAGMLLCGGAGNFATSAPEGKQITLPKDIPCVLAAAGTQEDGTRPDFSSKGPVTWSGVKFYDDYPVSKPLSKPDVSAPAAGFQCWGLADELRPQWKIVFQGSKNDVLVTGPRGNSFAGPHSAGVAALMFSANPNINPWQVKSIMEETCKDMGAPGRDYLHGAGLIQALPAVQKAKSLIK